MTWQGGRQLASMQKDGTTLSFSYNDAGLRTEKTVNGSTRRYVWNSSQLMADVGVSDAFYFHYSSGGELIGYTYKTAEAETECILVKNQQGDVERVISADGTIQASYTYDAWGNVLTAEGSLAASNPIRYRGYYFDAETGLYYLQSRYYDPAVGRFINADGLVSAGQGIHSCNMFAYCENNPVSSVDKDGYLAFPGEIHNLVVAYLAETYGWLKEQRIDYKDSVLWGRADLISKDGEVWEVKRDKPKHIAKGLLQIKRYVENTWHNHSNVDLDYGYEIESGQLAPYRSGATTYYITYRYYSSGLILYDYTSEVNWKSVADTAGNMLLLTGIFGLMILSSGMAPVPAI